MPTQLVETGAAALLFAATFLWGGRVRPFGRFALDQRSVVSFGAGMSAAYVFVHVMPELHGARLAFAEGASITLRYEGMAVYFLALVGFLCFYALDHVRARLKEGSPEEAEGGSDFKLHVAGFAAYAGLMAYLLVHRLEDTRISTAAYAVAITFHFLAVAHSLRDEHGAAFENRGRFVLAGAILVGWVVGMLVPMPAHVVALFLAFISGAIIMNSTIMELPSEKDGRFVPFLLGGIIYGLILLPLG